MAGGLATPGANVPREDVARHQELQRRQEHRQRSSIDSASPPDPGLPVPGAAEATAEIALTPSMCLPRKGCRARPPAPSVGEPCSTHAVWDFRGAGRHAADSSNSSGEGFAGNEAPATQAQVPKGGMIGRAKVTGIMADIFPQAQTHHAMPNMSLGRGSGGSSGAWARTL